MQYDPNQQGYNNNRNHYVPMNQPPQFETGNAYSPNNAPPPSTQYPQQPPPPPGTSYYSQMPASNPQCVVVTSGYQAGNLSLTPITPSLKMFLLISGSLYLLWGILDIGLDVGIVNNSHTFLYYCGFWASGFFISGGVFMLVAASKTSYAIVYLLQMFIVTLIPNVLGLIMAIITLMSSLRCDRVYFICDNSLAVNLKIVLLVLFVITTIHTVVGILMITTSRNKTRLQSASNVQSTS